jgi:hypothetical protein
VISLSAKSRVVQPGGCCNSQHTVAALCFERLMKRSGYACTTGCCQQSTTANMPLVTRCLPDHCLVDMPAYSARWPAGYCAVRHDNVWFIRAASSRHWTICERASLVREWSCILALLLTLCHADECRRSRGCSTASLLPWAGSDRSWRHGCALATPLTWSPTSLPLQQRPTVAVVGDAGHATLRATAPQCAIETSVRS